MGIRTLSSLLAFTLWRRFLYLVTELMDTDLGAVLPQLTDDRVRVQVTMDVASAVAFFALVSASDFASRFEAGQHLISLDGRIKLTDFGVSRLLVDSATQKAQMTRDAGTLLYMAPEVFSSNVGYDTSADVYSFGLVVIEVWTGMNPFAPHEFTWIFEFMDRIMSKEVVPGFNNLPRAVPR